ncbi:bcl-2-binding component 3, isoforms 3/4-like isoform X1 [Mustela nigripes]|uniref:bcl-2-binding component 3, isoforms 3/4-like isoform X1 n=1 Tax=Mustela nigripes TaxID=77151 RepID=UPI0028151D28|nr:bcl-2-binding component 3, isoforms 3/4-like isoform X1 [Mustela nigripes]
MPSLKAERRIRPGSRGLAAALGWLPAGGAPPRRPGLGSSRCWALQLRRPRPPLPGSERTPTPRRRRRVPAARPGLSPTPPRLLPPGTAPPGNGWSCTALPVPAVSQLLHARTQSLSPGSATASGRRLSVASGGIPTESRSPRNRTRPEPCPALWSLAKPGATAQIQSPTAKDGEFTGHARSRAGPECRGGGVSRCGRRRPRRARRSPAGRSAPALFSTLSGGWRGSEGPFLKA